MNDIILKGYIKDIKPSHTIQAIEFEQAKLIVPRNNGVEDTLNIKFKKYSNKYKENDVVSLRGNIRSYSYKVAEDRNKVNIYVFTYFDTPEEDENISNRVILDGRICKIAELRHTKSDRDNLHLIIANNIISEDTSKRLNSYIPCIAWNTLARKISKLPVNTKIKIEGTLQSREHKQLQDDGEYKICVTHEVRISSFEVLD